MARELSTGERASATAGVILLLGTLAACSGGEGEPSVQPCNFAPEGRVSMGEALWVQAGATKFSDGRVVARLRYLEGGKRLAEVTSKGSEVGSFAVTNSVPTSKVTRYTRGVVSPENDACTPRPGDPNAKRPAEDAQIVTVTGTVTLGRTVYAGFNDGSRVASSASSAVTEGALSMPLPDTEGYPRKQE